MQKPHSGPDDVHTHTPQRGTARPYQWTRQPRGESARARMRAERESDGPHQRRLRWLEWVAEQIISTTLFADHSEDPRWDDLPPEWEYAAWDAAQKRDT